MEAYGGGRGGGWGRGGWRLGKVEADGGAREGGGWGQRRRLSTAVESRGQAVPFETAVLHNRAGRSEFSAVGSEALRHRGLIELVK